jgi:hypothetical protein
MALSGYLGQDEYGGHTFETDDPAQPTLYVPDIPEARQLAQALTVSAPQPLAQNAPQAQDWGADPSRQDPNAPPPEVTDAPPPVAAPPPRPELRHGLVAAPRSIVEAQQQLPTLPTAGAAPAGATSPVDLTPEEQRLIDAPAPYSPGVSQAQLEAKAQTGTAIPTSQSVEVSGAIPANPEIEAAYVSAKKAEWEAQQKLEADRAATQDAMRMDAVNRRIQAENEAVFAKAHQQAIETEARNKMLRVHQFDQEAQQRYADFGPDRFFKQRGTWAVIGAAIAQGLGAYAATIRGGPNYAQQIIQGAIDRDIESQRMEYLRDRDERANLVGELTAATGDVDVATEAAAAIQMNIAQAHADELAALSGRKDVQDNWNVWKAQFQTGIVDHMQKAWERGLGNTVLKTQATIKYPQAGGGGGPLTLEQRAKREKLGTEIVESRAKRADLAGGGSKETEIAPGVHARDKVEAKEIRGQVADLDATDRELATLQSKIKQHGTAARIGNKRIPFTSTPLSSTGAEIEAQRNVATGGLGQLSGSGIVNPGEYPRLKANLDTPEGIQGVRDYLAIKRRALLKGHASKPLPAEPTEAK